MQLRKQATSIQDVQDTIEIEHQKYSSQIEDLKTQLSQKNETIGELETGIEQRNGDIRTLRAELDALKRDHKIADQNYKSAQSTLTREREQVTDFKNERTKLMIELEKLKEDKFNLQANLDTARDDARDARRAQNKAENTIEEIQSAAELAESRAADNQRRLQDKIEQYSLEQNKDKTYISVLEKKLGE